MSNKFLLGLTIACVLFGFFFASVIIEVDEYYPKNGWLKNTEISGDETMPSARRAEENEKVGIGESADTKTAKKDILFSVPFTAQAPLGEWHDPRQQDGCEEAAVLMAMKWVENKKFESKTKDKGEILAISEFQSENYKGYQDTSAQDTVGRIFKSYFKHNKATVKGLNGVQDIIKELEVGNLVITPMNGQVLGNPYYTLPGPERHMIVIRGYNYETREFTTNDPGTRKGEGYKYNDQIFYQAIRDYPTGYREEIGRVIKAMIVVGK